MDRDGKGANPREHSERCDREECSQQRSNLKDNGYIYLLIIIIPLHIMIHQQSLLMSLVLY